MTMIPMWKTCSKCHKRYEWNPDIGTIDCPYCHGLGEKKKKMIEKALEDIDNIPDDVFAVAENPDLDMNMQHKINQTVKNRFK